MIIIYGHSRCGFCTKAKNLAAMHNLPVEWRDTDADKTLNDLKTKLPSVRTVPQIWWDERYIGGYDDFALEVENTIGGYGQGNV